MLEMTGLDTTLVGNPPAVEMTRDSATVIALMIAERSRRVHGEYLRDRANAAIAGRKYAKAG